MKLKLLSLYSFGRENIEHSYHLAKYIELTTSVKGKRSDSLDVASRSSKQQKIIAVVAVTLCQVSQANVGRLIICFFNEGLLPLSTVGRWSAVKPYCADMVSLMKANIQDTLRPLSFVATTTDCWTAHRGSYIGVAVYWIDPETLDRKWAALVCRRLHGSYTFDVLKHFLNKPVDRTVKKEVAKASLRAVTTTTF